MFRSLAWLVAIIGLNGVSWASESVDRAQPHPVLVGKSEKVCQLTGDLDWETGQPTAGRTLSRYGLDAVDLGYPVEHNGKLILLFGDSWPPHHGGGADGEVPPDDAVGVTQRRRPPDADGKCLELVVHDASSRSKMFAPATIEGPTKVKQGFFNVPSGGVSVGGRLYGFFWTDHCSDPNPIAPEPQTPLIRPSTSKKCPEENDRNSVGKGVLAVSDDDGRTFRNVVSMPTGFVYSVAVPSRPPDSRNDRQATGVLVFGVPRYRASIPYLAKAPSGSFDDPSTWRYYVGRDERGEPKWTSYEEWQRGAGSGAARSQKWQPPGEAELFIPAFAPGRCIGEFSVTWNQPLLSWLMLYGCHGQILARVAHDPWGPWSSPTPILGLQDHLGCQLVMTAEGCGNRRDFWPNRRHNGKFVSGGLYAPYVLNRYTAGPRDGSETDRSSTIYWVVSTWNPYEVVVIRTTLRLGSQIGPVEDIEGVPVRDRDGVGRVEKVAP